MEYIGLYRDVESSKWPRSQGQILRPRPWAVWRHCSLRKQILACSLCTCELRSSWESNLRKRANDASKSCEIVGQSTWGTNVQCNEWHLKCIASTFTTDSKIVIFGCKLGLLCSNQFFISENSGIWEQAIPRFRIEKNGQDPGIAIP